LEETIDTLTDTEKQDTMDKIEDIIIKLGEINDKVDEIKNKENEENEDLYDLIRLLGIIRTQATDAEKQKIKDEISSILAKITGEIKKLI
jgi:uncharacterized coiled-coil DUF342 family protein